MAQRTRVDVALTIIGRIHTPYKTTKAIPVFPAERNARGVVTIRRRYVEGLADVDGFDRLWLIYHGAPSAPPALTVRPPGGEELRGVFAGASLQRPNAIGLCCVRLLRVKGRILHVEGVDMLNGARLLDLQPYAPGAHAFPTAWAGWMENIKASDELWPVRPPVKSRRRRRGVVKSARIP